MQRHVSLAAIGLIAGLVMPTLAQPSSTAGDQQPLAGLGKQWQAAYNRKDAAGVAALYSANGTEVTSAGVFQGHDAVQKRIEADLALGGHDLSITTKSEQTSGNMAWGIGEWSGHYGAQPVHGW